MRGVVCFFVLLLAACDSKHLEYRSVLKEVKASHVVPEKILSGDELVADLQYVPAQVEEGGRPFFVLEREASMRHFPCTDCHDSDLDADITPEAFNRRAHWDVKFEHASSDTMNCDTCHDGTQNMMVLKTFTGQRVSYDHVYQVCGQCHFQQEADWRGGAHGKRLHGWAGDRVIANCTSCHNPHKPRFPKRWPKTIYTQSE